MSLEQIEAKIEEARSRQQYAIADRLSAKVIQIMNRDLSKKIRFEAERAHWEKLAQSFGKRVEESKEVAESQLKIKMQNKQEEPLSAADMLEEALKKGLKGVEEGLQGLFKSV